MSTAPNPLAAVESLLANIWAVFLHFVEQLQGRPSGAPAIAAPLPAGVAAPSTVTPKILKPTITVEQARQRAVASETNINPRDTWLTASGSNWDLVIRQLHRIYLDPNECGGQPPPSLKLSEAVAAAGIGSKALQLSPIAAGGGPVGLILLGVGAIVGIIQAIFTHHAQAVQRDIRAQCSLIPAANNALDIIIQGVQDGQLSAADGVIAMQQLPQVFLQQAGAAKNNSPYCNGVCGNLIVLRAICYYWQSQFESGAYG